jgi:hypothetical protein
LLTLASCSASAEEAGGWPGWVRPTVTRAIIYGSLYGIVVVSVQVASTIIESVASVAWGASAQTFGIPLLVVLVMAQLVPALRQAVPKVVNPWFDRPGV